MMHADAAAAGSASQTGGGAGKGKGNGKDDGGLSFAMLSRLIAEGRTAEVPVRDIPDGVNVSPGSLVCVNSTQMAGFLGHADAMDVGGTARTGEHVCPTQTLGNGSITTSP